MAIQESPMQAPPTPRAQRGSASVDLPPGPDAGRLAQSVAFHRDPLRFLQRARDRFGDVFTLRLAVAGTMVVVADPRAIDRIVESDPDAAHGGEGRRRILGVVSPRSVLGADGDRHRRARGPLEPAFAADTIAPLAEPIGAIAELRAHRWPTRRPIRALEHLRAIADEVFVRIALGIHDDRRAEALVAAIRGMLRTPGNPPLPVPGDQAGGLLGQLGKRVFERRQQPAADLIAREVDARRDAAEPGHDAIACLLRANPDLETADAVDQLVPLLMAGQEPQACALTWVLDRLTRNPELGERYLEDPTGPEATAILHESLRLTPPVHSVVRRLTQELYVGGYRLPRGITAAVPIVLVHRDPSVFPDPEEFRPGRFAGSEPPRAYMPFGGGNRRCLGEWLARAELAAVLPAVLKTRKVRPLSPRPERMVVRGTVLAPQRGGLALAT
jgi:cytochrome P450